MAIHRRGFLTVVIAIVATMSVVYAQPTDTDKAHALALFKESDQQYKRGDFEAAADLLREAYALYPEPILLYNLARALEGSGDTAGAIEQYERYLAAVPDLDDRGALERRVATLKAELARRTPPPAIVEERPPDGGGATTGTATVDGPQASSPPRAVPMPTEAPPARRLPWVIAGGGVAVLAAGATFGYLARARHDAAVDEPVQAEAARLQDQAHTFATVANVGLIGGGLLVAGGAIWGVIEVRRHRAASGSRTGARLLVGPRSVALAWELP